MATTKCSIELEPLIKKALDDKNNVKAIETHIKNYLGQNSEILSDTSLWQCPSFSRSEDQEVIFIRSGITRAQVKSCLERTSNKDVKTGWKMFSNEMYLACTMIIRAFVKKNDMNMANLVQMFFSLWIYSNLHGRKYWEFGCKKEVMDYTISTLSNKYDIKRMGSLIVVLKKIGEMNLQNSKSRLVSQDDDNIFVYARDLRTRLNGFLKNIAQEYYKNYEQGNYLNVDKDDHLDDEGDEYKMERSSDSGKIFSAAESFEIWFMTNKINEKIARIIANLTPEISPAKLISILNSIKADNSGRIKNIIVGMLGTLIAEQNDASLRGIHSKEFPIFCIRILSKSNSKNELIVNMKISLDSLLKEYCDTFRTTKREASKINYRKAVIMYFAMALQLQRK